MINKFLILFFLLFTTLNVSASYNTSIHDVKTLIIEQAQQQNLSPALALAVAKVESDFNVKATSQAGARGVMQIMPKTAEKVFGVSRNRLYEAEINIHLGIKFLKQLLNRYDQRLDLALSHYNGGSAVKRDDGTFQVIPVTKKYVDKVLSYYYQFDIKESYNPYNKESFSQQRTYNYIIGEPLKPASLLIDEPVKKSESYARIGLENRDKNKNKEIVYTAGMMIKGPVRKLPEQQYRNTRYQNHSMLEDKAWLDGYSVVKPMKKMKHSNKETKKLTSYITNDRQEKVRQWESIFK